MTGYVLRFLRAIGWLALAGLAGCASDDRLQEAARLSYLVDSSASLTINDMELQRNRFQTAPTSGINQPWTLSPYWFRLELDKAAWPTDVTEVALVLNSNMLKAVEFYQNGQLVNEAGYRVSILEQSIPHYDYVFLADVSNPGTTEIYFKIQAGTRMNVQLQVLSRQQFHQQSILQYLGLGLFLGAALVMVGYNLILALILFKSPYAYYSLYTLTLTLTLAFDAGLLRHFDFPNTNGTWGLMYNLPAMSALLFFRSFLPIKTIAPRFDVLMKVQIFIALFLMLVGGLFPPTAQSGIPYSMVNQISMVATVVTCVSAIGIALRHGFRPARWLAVAVALSAIALPIPALVVFGVLPEFPYRMATLRIVLIIELLLFSLGLADLYREQSRARRRDQQRHQEEMGQLMREVHDNIATDIHSAMLALPNHTEKSSAGLLQRALNNARDLASLLGQSHLGTSFSLEDGIRQYLNILQQHSDKKAELSYSTRLHLATPMQLQLYRIFQEWMSNCLRHGDAKNFRIELMQRPNVALLRIQSDGYKFRWDSRTADNNVGSGLLSIQHRCSNLKARVRVMAGAKSGCRFVLRVPLKGTVK